MGLTPAFWHNQKVLLTGHTGFKGSWLALWLQRLGAQVVGYALNPPTTPNLYECLGAIHQDIRGDIGDYPTLQQVFQTHQPTIVIHMAAQSLVRQSFTEPVATYAVNVMGTVNVLEAARQNDSTRVILNITSDKCYANDESGRAFAENMPLGGHDPYSSSKACAELVTAAYRHSYFSGMSVAVASARAGNVIGGGDWAKDRLIPDLVRAFLKGESLLLRNPQAIRPWQHVLEPLYGYLLLIEKLWHGVASFDGAWNFGPPAEENQPVAFIVDYFAQFWPTHLQVNVVTEAGWPEAQYLHLDSTKAKTELGWQSRLSLNEALQWTSSWYEAYGRQQNMRQFCEQQMAAYEERCS